jgi:hypothetical protein
MQKTQISIKNVPVDLLKQAQAEAKKQDRPLSQIIRDLLRIWVKQQQTSK